VCVLSARLGLELSECKVCLPCEVIIEWIMLYKVRRKPWGLSGSPAIVFDPSAWCGAVRTLCVGDVEAPFLGGEAPYQGDQGNLASAFIVSLCGKSSGALGRDLVIGKQYSCLECFNNVD
jgi:hypothetical protein